jgi:hypothetical protein
MEVCRYVAPVWKEVEPGHFCACHLYDSEAERAESERRAEEAKAAGAENSKAG